jgi:chemotaxis protein methyltransferase CheR
MECSATPLMKPEEFRLIREFTAERFGLVIDQGKEGYLAARLLPRLQELRLGSFAEYYSFLKFAPRCTEEHARYISLITNNETYFFREMAQLNAFAELVLPELKARKIAAGSKRLRILSAGCSSGEEVYTLAMLLLQSGLFVWDWDLRITGIDIDPQVLAKAEAGIYTGRAFQSTPPLFIDSYFRECEQGFQVRDQLRKICNFSRGNMLSLPGELDSEPADIIFCRNVLIYFDEVNIKRVIDNFAAMLVADGLLFLGHAESLTRITSQFVPILFPGAIVYRKKT